MLNIEKYKLFNGGCIDVMTNIQNNSIDMILCDLPYGTTGCKWDNIIDFDELWREYNRIIKGNLQLKKEKVKLVMRTLYITKVHL